MICKIRRKENSFVMIDNEVFNNPNLSYTAKGILGYLLAKPDNWIIRVSDIAKNGKISLNAIKSALKELRINGYAEIIKDFDSKKKLKGSHYVIYESPILVQSEPIKKQKPCLEKTGRDTNIYEARKNSLYNKKDLINNKDTLTHIKKIEKPKIQNQENKEILNEVKPIFNPENIKSSHIKIGKKYLSYENFINDSITENPTIIKDTNEAFKMIHTNKAKRKKILNDFFIKDALLTYNFKSIDELRNHFKKCIVVK